MLVCITSATTWACVPFSCTRSILVYWSYYDILLIIWYIGRNSKSPQVAIVNTFLLYIMLIVYIFSFIFCSKSLRFIIRVLHRCDISDFYINIFLFLYNNRQMNFMRKENHRYDSFAKSVMHGVMHRVDRIIYIQFISITKRIPFFEQWGGHIWSREKILMVASVGMNNPSTFDEQSSGLQKGELHTWYDHMWSLGILLGGDFVIWYYEEFFKSKMLPEKIFYSVVSIDSGFERFNCSTS